MDISASELYTSTCPQCGITFDHEIWLIVDAIARPDLLERAFTDLLYEVRCPRNHRVRSEAPLLIRSRGTPQTIFSPTPGSPPAQQQEQLDRLFNILQARIGAAAIDLLEWPAAIALRENLLRAGLDRDTAGYNYRLAACIDC
jgi:hypothetical protein